MRPGRTTKWLLILAAWTAAGLISGSLEYFTAIAVNRPNPFSLTAVWNLVALYLFALTFPAVTYIGRKYAWERQQWLRRGVIYALAIVVLSTIHLIAFWVIYWSFGGPRLPRGAPAADAFAYFQVLFFSNMRTNLIIYGLLFVGVVAAYHYRRYLAGEQRAAQLREQLAQAQLEALKMQLHPHFLFNTLNAISELVHNEPEVAERMLVQLSEMLRHTLESAGAQEVPLQQELEFLNSYLQIQRTRFRDRLEIRMSIAPATLSAYVPNMLLQPLVENAIRHGIAPLARGGTIDVGAERENGSLRLSVRDNGRGVVESAPNGRGGAQGVGLTNTRARLQQLYGAGKYELTLSGAPDAGVLVNVTIPFREQPHETHSSADC